jgi:hypothetical protein
VTRFTVAAIAALALAPVAGAQPQQSEPGSGFFDLRLQAYRPNIDSEFGGTSTPPFPYQKVFGSGNGLMFGVEGGRTIFDKFGSFDLGLGVSYFQASAKALYQPNGGLATDPSTWFPAAADKTAFHVIPVTLFAQYRLDYFADKYNVPLAPFARIAFDRYNWWVTGTNKSTKIGATNGWSFSGGLMLLLDFFDRQLAREMYHDTGIRHSYLFVDATKSSIDDFGSSKSWDLSTAGWSIGGGLMFVY